MKKILAINLGSTSTKLSLFEDDTLIQEVSLTFPKENPGRLAYILDEFEPRLASVNAFLEESGIDLKDIDIFVSRGGLVGKVEYGAYEINKDLVKMLCFSDRKANHPSSLAPVVAYTLAQRAGGKPAIFYDAVSANQVSKLASMSGMPGVEREITGHNLNSRMVGREAAEKLGKKYEDSKLVIAHLGGGISVSAHENGIISDMITCDEGPMGPQRAGRVSFIRCIQLAYVDKLSMAEMQRITDAGGLLSYFNIKTMQELEALIAEGNEEARYYYEVMAYQAAKTIGEMMVALNSEADAIVLTGGLANSKMFTEWVTKRVEKLAPVMIIPGEREMLAMARGGMRVLAGEEPVKHIAELPAPFKTMDEYVEHFKQVRTDVLDMDIVKKMMAL